MIFFSLSIFFPPFLRVCLSGCAHGVHANRKALAVALLQRHSIHTGKRDGEGGWWMKEENGVTDGRTTLSLSSLLFFIPSFLYLSSVLSPFFLSPTLASFFLPSQSPLPFFLYAKLLPRHKPLRRRIYPCRGPSDEFSWVATTFCAANPHNTIVLNIRE